MAEEVLHIEEVYDGDFATWPWKTGDDGYKEPTLPGCVFVGWEFNGTVYRPPYNASNNPFGEIYEDTDINAVFGTFDCHADTNHSIIGGDGDSDEELTELIFWADSNGDTTITDGVTIEDVPLADGMLPIVFEDKGTSVINGKNVKKIKVIANDLDDNRYYRFKAVYQGLESSIVEIRQIGASQILLPPFDYLTFTYSWGDNDGIDLDSATYVRNSHIPIETSPGQTLDDYFVGYNGIDYNDVSDEVKTEVRQYMEYGGDNVISGDEGAMINWKKICDRDYISQGINTLYLDIYANWYHYKGDGNLSISFKTYKGNDGLTKSGYIFVPQGDTVQVSDTVLSGINVYSTSSSNKFDIKNHYSKVATVEYDIRSKQAVTIPATTRSGREVIMSIIQDGEIFTNVYREVVELRDITIGRSSRSGTLVLSNYKEKIDGEETIYNFENGVEKGDEFTSTEYSISDGGKTITVNWTVSENNTDDIRYPKFRVYTEPSIAYPSYNRHAFEFTIIQTTDE